MEEFHKIAIWLDNPKRISRGSSTIQLIEMHMVGSLDCLSIKQSYTTSLSVRFHPAQFKFFPKSYKNRNLLALSILRLFEVACTAFLMVLRHMTVSLFYVISNLATTNLCNSHQRNI